MRLTKWAARLYPLWWRERYGEEFEALLEDARPGIGGAVDIAKGAMAMQARTWSIKRMMLVGAIAGLIVSGAFLLLRPLPYHTDAVISFATNPSGVQRDLNSRIGDSKIQAIERFPVNSAYGFKLEFQGSDAHQAMRAAQEIARAEGGLLLEIATRQDKRLSRASVPVIAVGVGAGVALGALLARAVARRNECA